MLEPRGIGADRVRIALRQRSAPHDDDRLEPASSQATPIENLDRNPLLEDNDERRAHIEEQQRHAADFFHAQHIEHGRKQNDADGVDEKDARRHSTDFAVVDEAVHPREHITHHHDYRVDDEQHETVSVPERKHRVLEAGKCLERAHIDARHEQIRAYDQHHIEQCEEEVGYMTLLSLHLWLRSGPHSMLRYSHLQAASDRP